MADIGDPRQKTREDAYAWVAQARTSSTAFAPTEEYLTALVEYIGEWQESIQTRLIQQVKRRREREDAEREDAESCERFHTRDGGDR